MASLQEITSLLSEEGPFAEQLPTFESRPQQQQMLEDILSAYEKDKIAVIEAGTGTGKSLAYLLPALLWAQETEEKTVISTNTINLQEQLLNKDIPLIKKVLGINIKVVLAKGMSNYLCLRKLAEVEQEPHLHTEEEQEELQQIFGWAKRTKEGCKSSLPLLPKPTTWDHVAAEGDACPGKQCPHYKECFFFKARRKATDAQVIIANHHLLFADLNSRAEQNNFDAQAVLPAFKRVVLDEAHNIEDVATDHFADRANQASMLRQLGRIYRDKRGQAPTGKLVALRNAVAKMFPVEHDEKVKALLHRLDIELPGDRTLLTKLLNELFNALNDFLDTHTKDTTETKLRLRQRHLDDPLWKGHVLEYLNRFLPAAKGFIGSLWCLKDQIETLDSPELTDSAEGILLDLSAATRRLEEEVQLLEQFTSAEEKLDQVTWIEVHHRRGFTNTELIIADLDISEALVRHLFRKFSTVALTSATLSTNQNFEFVKHRLGLVPENIEPDRLIEKIYPSPFDFTQQALVTVPSDLPDPNHPDFLQETTEALMTLIQASRGNAFVLFTSYNMMRRCEEILADRLKTHRVPLFVQGDDTREALLNKFRHTEYSVLFGTDSFWEGVDVTGDALRCVIIVKLPFQVPSEPLIQARTEAITAAGGNAFLDYSVPNAIVKFKQGVGRLIRHKEDRGVIACLDSRLLTKSYGKKFLNSLPRCRMFVGGQEEVAKVMKTFYWKSREKAKV